MATHSSILARRIRRTEEPGGLQSMGLQRVGCDLASVGTRTDNQGLCLLPTFSKLSITLFLIVVSLIHKLI